MTDTPDQKMEPFKPPFHVVTINGASQFIQDSAGRAVDYDWIAAAINHPSQANASPESVEGEREAFEAAYNASGITGSGIGVWRERDGEYGHERWRHAWWAWQAARSTPKPAPDAPVTYAQSVSAACPNCGNGFVSVSYRAESPKPAPGDAAKRAAEAALNLMRYSYQPTWTPAERIEAIAATIAQHTAPALTEEEQWQVNFAERMVDPATGEDGGKPDLAAARLRTCLFNVLAILRARITGAQHG